MITYPVAPNSRWSLYNTDTLELVAHNKPWPRKDGMEIVDLADNLVPLLEVTAEQPAYDPATQKLEATVPVVDVGANTYTHGWNVVARTQAELDADAELAAVKAVYVALKAHSGTAEERLTRMENVLAYILKSQYAAE